MVVGIFVSEIVRSVGFVKDCVAWSTCVLKKHEGEAFLSESPVCIVQLLFYDGESNKDCVVNIDATLITSIENLSITKSLQKSFKGKA